MSSRETSEGWLNSDGEQEERIASADFNGSGSKTSGAEISERPEDEEEDESDKDEDESDEDEDEAIWFGGAFSKAFAWF